MSAVRIQRLVAVAQAAQAAGHGEKQEIYDKACTDLGISLATLHRELGRLKVETRTRKQRSDAGQSGLSQDEAKLLSGVLMETIKQNGKRLYSICDAVTGLRANGLIRAERMDKSTGELLPLSDSAISRAMKGYGLHPDQLLAPDPHSEMASKHPNHVWQIDASLCVLYYLKPIKGQCNGLQVMDADKFYKNKPRNLKSVAADRVWSYEITDHCSGWIYVEYVMGAESGENLCNVLINALQERESEGDILHGVPHILYMDPGSANTSAMAKNLCKSLGIEAIAHAPGQARATGQVENARNIIERKFEAGLKFQPVADLAELNALAAQWRSVFNCTAIHRRHGKSRTDVWMTISQEQLIKAPSVEVCRELAVAEPVSRTVTPKLRISFHGEEYDVSQIPGIRVGEKIMVTRNPWRSDAAQIVMRDERGHEVFHVVNKVLKTEYGFAENAPVFGESYSSMADTESQKAKAAIEQMMTGTETQSEAEAARKRKELPLGGRYQPYKQLDDANLPTFMPRRGTEHDLNLPTLALPPLTHVQAAKKLRQRMGAQWKPEHFEWLQRTYPEGVAEDQLDAIVAELTKPKTATLKVV
ncbi:hypothetical protein [Neptuniibacter sp.]|uniref:hypothetical protein n=1 Tax=Neptuniibacter sp. TaxID=1962643 RepID=UPI003B5A6FD3